MQCTAGLVFSPVLAAPVSAAPATTGLQRTVPRSVLVWCAPLVLVAFHRPRASIRPIPSTFHLPGNPSQESFLSFIPALILPSDASLFHDRQISESRCSQAECTDGWEIREDLLRFLDGHEVGFWYIRVLSGVSFLISSCLTRFRVFSYQMDR